MLGISSIHIYTRKNPQEQTARSWTSIEKFLPPSLPKVRRRFYQPPTFLIDLDCQAAQETTTTPCNSWCLKLWIFFPLPSLRSSSPLEVLALPASTIYSLLRGVRAAKILIRRNPDPISCDIHDEIGALVDSFCHLASVACCFSASWSHGPMCRCKTLKLLAV